MKKLVFISSVQKELAVERRALKEYIQKDAILGQFFDVFLFEDMPASGRRADKVYLAEVDRCDIYLGLFGNEYGYEDAEGISPTEREFDRAAVANKERLIYVKGDTDSARHPKMRALLRKAGDQLIRRRFTETSDLLAAVYASLAQYLSRTGIIQDRPFDQQICPGATLNDINPQAVFNFVRRARAARKFPLEEQTPAVDVLTHLRMLVDGLPTRAAILLFGRDPQKFMPSAETRCMHFHGTEIRRPAPFYRIFQGTLFEQADQAENFVLSVINQSIGTRKLSMQAPAEFEIPPDVIHEAIVNAIAHRDYASLAAIQVSVFADRVEIWNPGTLLPPLTLELLRQPHRSVARNTEICEGLFLTKYIEKYGTGTLLMIQQSIEHALPEPDFGQQPGEFSVTIWRDWLTAGMVASMELNSRQIAAISFLRVHRIMSSADYQRLTSAPRRTATRDLDALVAKGLLIPSGTKRGTKYILTKAPPGNAPVMRQMRHMKENSPSAGTENDYAPVMRQMRQGTVRASAKSKKTTAKQEILRQATQAAGPKAQKTAQKNAQEIPQKIPQEILRLIAQNPTIARQQMAETLGITDDRVKYQLRKMQEKNMIRRVGPDKGGHWEIVQSKSDTRSPGNRK